MNKKLLTKLLWYRTFWQLIRYSVVGVANTIASYGSFYIFHKIFTAQSVSLLLSTLVSCMVSYELNSKFTFKASVNRLRYLLYVFTLACVGYGCGRAGDFYHLHLWQTFLIDILVCLPVGFTFSKFIIFKK